MHEIRWQRDPSRGGWLIVPDYGSVRVGFAFDNGDIEIADRKFDVQGRSIFGPGVTMTEHGSPQPIASVRSGLFSSSGTLTYGERDYRWQSHFLGKRRTLLDQNGARLVDFVPSSFKRGTIEVGDNIDLDPVVMMLAVYTAIRDMKQMFTGLVA